MVPGENIVLAQEKMVQAIKQLPDEHQQQVVQALTVVQEQLVAGNSSFLGTIFGSLLPGLFSNILPNLLPNLTGTFMGWITAWLAVPANQQQILTWITTLIGSLGKKP